MKKSHAKAQRTDAKKALKNFAFPLRLCVKNQIYVSQATVEASG